MASPMPVFMPWPLEGLWNMRGVAEQRGASLPKKSRHTVVHVISREPVHLVDLNLQVIDRPVADVLEPERLPALREWVLDGPDQPRAAHTGERKDRQEVCLVQINVQFAIDWRAGSLYVGNIEDLVIGAARKPCAHRLTHYGA